MAMLGDPNVHIVHNPGVVDLPYFNTHLLLSVLSPVVNNTKVNEGCSIIHSDKLLISFALSLKPHFPFSFEELGHRL